MTQRTSSGHEVSVMSKEWLEKMEKDQTGYKGGMIKLLPEGWLVPTAFLNFEKQMYNFKFRSTDVLLMTMPKSGTTWTQEILWTMLQNPNLDNKRANLNIMARAPQIDMDMLFDSKYQIMDGMTTSANPFLEEFMAMCPGRNPTDGIFIQLLEFLPDPRLVKTHLPFAFFQPDILDTVKVVYVARNPKDVIVSMCHHFRLLKLHNYTGTFEAFVKDFMKDDLLYSPYWPHIKMAWERRNHSNLHFMFYEDMKANIKAEIQKLNEFLGTKLSQGQLDKIEEYTSFGAMKKRAEEFAAAENMSVMNEDVEKSAGGFFRKGQTGDWKNNFTPELLEEMNKWINSNANEIGITFK